MAETEESKPTKVDVENENIHIDIHSNGWNLPCSLTSDCLIEYSINPNMDTSKLCSNHVSMLECKLAHYKVDALDSQDAVIVPFAFIAHKFSNVIILNPRLPVFIRVGHYSKKWNKKYGFLNFINHIKTCDDIKVSFFGSMLESNEPLIGRIPHGITNFFKILRPMVYIANEPKTSPVRIFTLFGNSLYYSTANKKKETIYVQLENMSAGYEKIYASKPSDK